VARFGVRLWACGGWVSGRSRAHCLASGVQVAQYLRVGGQQACLGVGNAALGAERPHGRLGVPQIRPRHGREQVVLNLVVKPTKGEVGEHAAADIA